jgi:hypothetical protein
LIKSFFIELFAGLPATKTIFNLIEQESYLVWLELYFFFGRIEVQKKNSTVISQKDNSLNLADYLKEFIKKNCNYHL